MAAQFSKADFQSALKIRVFNISSNAYRMYEKYIKTNVYANFSAHINTDGQCSASCQCKYNSLMKLPCRHVLSLALSVDNVCSAMNFDIVQQV